MQTAVQASAQKDIQIHAHTLTRTQYNSHLLTCTHTPTPPRTAYTETAHGSARTYAQRTQHTKLCCTITHVLTLITLAQSDSR